MKKILACLIFASALVPVFAQQTEGAPKAAAQLVKESQELAARTNRNVIVMFHASW